jgi:putative FmdB family regulatory protein
VSNSSTHSRDWCPTTKMPNYDFECSECKKVTERFTKVGARFVVCECGGIAKKVISSRHVAAQDFYSGWTGPGGRWEDLIFKESIYIRNKEHLKQVCLERDLYNDKEQRGPVVLLNGGR